MNQKLFTLIQGSAICIKIKQKLTPKKQKWVNHKQIPVDKDIHQFHLLLNMIDRPVNTSDYNIPQIQPKPVEPTQSVVEIPKPVQAAPVTPLPPPLEAIQEEPELESEQQQESQQYGIDVIPVTEENLTAEINKNKQCINNCPGIEISECDDTSYTNPEDVMKQSHTFLKEIFNSKLHFSPQIYSYYAIKQAKEEVVEMPQSDDVIQSSQEVPPFHADGGQQERGGSLCITSVRAETHDYWTNIIINTTWLMHYFTSHTMLVIHIIVIRNDCIFLLN